MEDSARDSVIPHATTEPKRVIPDVIAVVEQGPRSIAGSTPALAANGDKGSFNDKVSMEAVRAQCEARIAQMKMRLMEKKFALQMKRLELEAQLLINHEKRLEESIVRIEADPRLRQVQNWLRSIRQRAASARKYIRSGRIPTVVIGKIRYITDDAIEEFLRLTSHQQESKEEQHAFRHLP